MTREQRFGLLGQQLMELSARTEVHSPTRALAGPGQQRCDSCMPREALGTMTNKTALCREAKHDPSGARPRCLKD